MTKAAKASQEFNIFPILSVSLSSLSHSDTGGPTSLLSLPLFLSSFCQRKSMLRSHSRAVVGRILSRAALAPSRPHAYRSFRAYSSDRDRGDRDRAYSSAKIDVEGLPDVMFDAQFDDLNTAHKGTVRVKQRVKDILPSMKNSKLTIPISACLNQAIAHLMREKVMVYRQCICYSNPHTSYLLTFLLLPSYSYSSLLHWW
jgi:hypothetical protein